MRYILRNKIHGTQVTAPSEAARDNILGSCKKGKDNKPVWELFKEIEDDAVVVKHQEFSIKELEAMLAAKKGLESPAKAVKTVDKVVEDDAELNDLKKQFEVTFGRKPHHKKSAESLAAEIAEKVNE